MERLRIDREEVTARDLFGRMLVYRQTGLVRGLPLELDVAIHLASVRWCRRAAIGKRGALDSIGVAKAEMGERSGGAQGLSMLADAVAAHRAALGVHAREALPAEWARTQNNLGCALQTQSAHSGGAEGLALLADAVVAYRAALEVRTREALSID